MQTILLALLPPSSLILPTPFLYMYSARVPEFLPSVGFGTFTPASLNIAPKGLVPPGIFRGILCLLSFPLMFSANIVLNIFREVIGSWSRNWR